MLVYLNPRNTDTVADAVLGQPDFVSNTPNNGGVSASSLSGSRAVRLGVAETGSKVYVADTANHRVLVYNSPLTTDTVADAVYGQPNFTSNTANNGGVSASSLNTPTAMHVDHPGNIWIADSLNHRVLGYRNTMIPDMVADAILGQPDFVSNTANNGGVSASSLNNPGKLIVDYFGRIIVADTDNNRVLHYRGTLPALNIDFAGSGLWMRNNAAWFKLLNGSPQMMVAGDLDNNGQDDLILDFGRGPGLGTWIRQNNSFMLVPLHPGSPQSMVTGDLDNNGLDEVIMDFGASGVWIRLNNFFWVKLHPGNPQSMVTADLDNNGQDEIIFDFGRFGIWIRVNNSSWVQLHPGNPEMMVAGDLDGNGQDELIIDFGGSGIWIRVNNTSWAKLHNLSSESMIACGDLDGNGQGEVIVDFGRFGIWIRLNNTSWVKLHNLSPESMAIVDLDDNGQDELSVDFGRFGLWVWRNNTSWEKLHSSSPESMVGTNSGRFGS